MDSEPDWSTLFEGEKYKGRLAMRDYALEGIVIAAMYVGIPRDQLFKMGDKELAECKKALLAQKKLLRTYWNSIGDLTNLFASGEVVCAFSWVPPYYDLQGPRPRHGHGQAEGRRHRLVRLAGHSGPGLGRRRGSGARPDQLSARSRTTASFSPWVAPTRRAPTLPARH